jgi:hypothetical protein
MPCGRPENEFGVGFGMEADRLVQRLEHREFACLHGLGNSEASATECNPANAVIGRRLIAPGLLRLSGVGPGSSSGMALEASSTPRQACRAMRTPVRSGECPAAPGRCSAGSSSRSGGSAIQSWNPRVRPGSPAPPRCHAPRPALNHPTLPSGSSKIPMKAAQPASSKYLAGAASRKFRRSTGRYSTPPPFCMRTDCG